MTRTARHGEAAPMEGFQRPDYVVLPDEAVVPPANLIAPAPNCFTHELARPEPFYYAPPHAGGARPNGEFPAGAKVVLLAHDGDEFCRVADGRGLYVVTRFAALKPVSK